MYKEILALLGIMWLSTNAQAQIGQTFKVTDSDGNNVQYEIISDSEVKYDGVRDYKQQEEVARIVVPQNIMYQGKTYKVTELEPGCFFNYRHMKEVILPNSIKKLPAKKLNSSLLGTFDLCYELRNVSLPDQLEDIGCDAFHSCRALKHIDIPKSVKAIGDFAFDYCGLEEISIPEEVETIGNRAFSNCVSLTEITFPNKVKTIGSGCLNGCKNLKFVRLPDGIKELNTYKGSGVSDYSGFFEGCSNLESIQLPASITRIGGACFKDCSNLKSIIIPDNVETLPSVSWYYEGRTAYYGCFENCTSLKEIILSKNLKTIGCDCFIGCKSLQNVAGLNSSISLETHTYSDAYSGYRSVTCTPFDGTDFKIDSVKQTFSYTAEPQIRNAIETWQKKKEYETTAQWQQRVTEASRKAKVEELMEQYRREYITSHTPKKFSGSIGNYDADYNAFPVKVEGMNMIFVKVPSDVAGEFKEKWDKIAPKAMPVYGVVDNNMAVLSCTFKFKGQEYGLAQTFKNDDSENLSLNLSPLDLDLGGGNVSKPSATIAFDNSLDLNVPVVAPNSNVTTFAIIIGNEKYTQVAEVPYANNDAKVFAEYCKKTLGMPIQNIRRYENATFGTMLTALSDIKSIAEAYEGNLNVIFYYAGHGVPNETTKDAFLLPVDADGKQTEACYPVSRLYKELGALGAKNVVVFMDACFSGAQRGEGMLASARGVAIKSKHVTPEGNIVVFSAAQGDETAYPYKEKGHGLFTYFLLKKLQDSKGDCTLGELGDFIQSEVRKQSVVFNRKSQTPTVVVSNAITDTWKMMKLK